MSTRIYDNPLVCYIDELFVSGNEIPVTTTLLSKQSWDLIKELLAEGLPLDHNLIEAELVYRRLLATYGEDTRRSSPLAAFRVQFQQQQPQP